MTSRLRLLVLALAVCLVGCTDLTMPGPGDPVSAPSFAQDAPLVPVPVGQPPEYDRDAFGPRWADVDRNGCDTRNDILARDLDPDQRRPGTRDCVVTGGMLLDPYTGELIEFVRGERTSALVHIDHVVPLSWAWEHGAWRWTPEMRRGFANDPANLLATAGAVNSAKGDSGPSEWLPQGVDRQCDYARRWDELVHAWGLSIGPDDLRTLTDFGNGCP